MWNIRKCCVSEMKKKTLILQKAGFHSKSNAVAIDMEILPLSLVSLFNAISTFVGYLMPKPFSSKNSRGTI